MPLEGEQLQSLIRQIIQMQVTISSVAIATTIFMLSQLTEGKIRPARIGVGAFAPSRVSFYRVFMLASLIYAIVVPIYEIDSYVSRYPSDVELVGRFTVLLGVTFFVFAAPLIFHLIALILDLK